MNMDTCDIFERKYAMYTFLAIADNPFSSKRQILRLGGRDESTVFARIGDLIEAGLVILHEDDDGIIEPVMELSPKGVKLLWHIVMIADILGVCDENLVQTHP